MITLYQPERINVNGKSRLQAKFEVDGVENLLWYETDKKYGKYMTTERADAFVVGLLWLGLKKGQDIKVLGTLSEKLCYSLNHYLIPLIKDIYKYKPIRVLCDQLVSAALENNGAVGTGLSCGIDSLSTIIDHMGDAIPKHYKITHLTFFDVGFSLTTSGRELTAESFQARIAMVEACAKDLGKELIVVNSNLNDVLDMDFVLTHTLRNMSAVLVFQKLFHAYYYSSGYRTADLKFNEDAASYDVISLPLLATESLSLYSSGSNYTRVEKTKMVAGFAPSYKYLNVCINQGKINCGRCIKCLRTLLTMEIIGVVDRYKNIFNLAAYYKAREGYIKKVIKYKNTNPFFKEIYAEILQTGYFDKQKD